MAYLDGQEIRFRVPEDSAGPTTIALPGEARVPLETVGGPLGVGTLVAGQLVTAHYSDARMAFIIGSSEVTAGVTGVVGPGSIEARHLKAGTEEERAAWRDTLGITLGDTTVLAQDMELGEIDAPTSFVGPPDESARQEVTELGEAKALGRFFSGASSLGPPDAIETAVQSTSGDLGPLPGPTSVLLGAPSYVHDHPDPLGVTELGQLPNGVGVAPHTVEDAAIVPEEPEEPEEERALPRHLYAAHHPGSGGAGSDITLWVVDIEDPSNSTNLGDTRIPGDTGGLAAFGGSLYLSSYNNRGLYRIDPHDVSASEEVGDWPSGLTNPYGLTVHFGKMYGLDDSGDDLWVIDPDDVTSGTVAATRVSGTIRDEGGTTFGAPGGLASYEGRLYALDDTRGSLWRLNLTDLSKSEELGTMPVGTSQQALGVHRGVLYSASASNRNLYRVNVEDPASSEVVGQLPARINNPYGLASFVPDAPADRALYALTDGKVWRIPQDGGAAVEVPDPGHYNPTAGTDHQGEALVYAFDVAIERLRFNADGQSVNANEDVGLHPFGYDDLRGLASLNGVLYAVDNDSEIRILDPWTLDDNGRIVSHSLGTHPASAPRELAAHDGALYLYANEKIWTVDLDAVPTSVSLGDLPAGLRTSSSFLGGMVSHQGFLHVLDSDAPFGLWRVNLEDIGGSVKLGDVTGLPTDVGAMLSYAPPVPTSPRVYAVHRPAGAQQMMDLWRIDPLDPARSRFVGTITNTGTPGGMAVHDGTLYLAREQTEGLVRVNPADASEVKVGDWPSGLSRPQALASHNGVLYAFDSTGDDLWTLDLSVAINTSISGTRVTGTVHDPDHGTGGTDLGSPGAMTSFKGDLYAIDDTNRLLWRINTAALAMSEALGSLPGTIDAQSLVVYQGKMYAGTRGTTGRLYEVDVSDPSMSSEVGALPTGLTYPAGMASFEPTFPQYLYGIALSTGHLWRVYPDAPGESVDLGDTGISSPASLAEKDGVLYVGTSNARLYRMNPAIPQQATLIGTGPTNLSWIGGLAWHKGTLYALDATGTDLWSIDPTVVNNGAYRATHLHDLDNHLGAFDTVRSLESFNGVLYAMDQNGLLVSIDVDTPASSAVIGTVTGADNGLASLGDQMYALGSNLYEVDVSDASTDDLGAVPSGITAITAVELPRKLSRDITRVQLSDGAPTDSRTLYTINHDNSHLWRIPSPSNPGGAVEIGHTTGGSPRCLTAHNGVLWTVTSEGKHLWSINPANLAAALVDVAGLPEGPRGEIVPEALFSFEGSLYAITMEGVQLADHPEIFRLDLSGSTLTLVRQGYVNALFPARGAVTHQGRVYMVSESGELRRINPTFPLFPTLVGQLPPHLNYESLTSYGGKLYAGTRDQGSLVEVDLGAPGLSVVLGTFPSGLQDPRGLAAV